MKNHNTGYYCWIGGEATWHMTYNEAVKMMLSDSSAGSQSQIDCCICGNRVDRCTCDADEDREIKMNDTKIQIIECDETDDTALYSQYQGQTNPQPCYIEIDCESGEIRATVDGEIGNAVPASVWHGRTIRFGIPCGTLPDEANRLMSEIADDAQTMIDHYSSEWDGSNHIGRLDAAAWDNRSDEAVMRGDHPDTPGADAQSAIEHYLESAASDVRCLRHYDAAEFFDYSETDRDAHKAKLRSGMSADTLEDEICAEYDGQDISGDGPTCLENVGYYIEQLREEIEEDGAGECEDCKHCSTEAPHGPRCTLVDSLTLLDDDSEKCAEYCPAD